MAEHCGYNTWLSQDVPDRFKAGLLGYLCSCADCRHFNLCHPNGVKSEYRGQSCSFYGRNMKIKGKVKLPKSEDDDA